MNAPLKDPRQAQAFRFVRHRYADGVAELVYAFDDGPELIERIRFPDAPDVPAERADAFAAALDLLHLVAGVSYYKAGVPPRIEFDGDAPDAATAAFMGELYRHGLAEFAYRNALELRDRIHFPRRDDDAPPAASADLPQHTLIPIGGGKDSLVAIEAIKRAGLDGTVIWVGHSPLIAACAERTGLPMLNVGRELPDVLLEYNRIGAYNGHVPVTAINSCILVLAALLYGFDTITFANERSASAATLEYEGGQVNHQWSKSLDFERALGEYLHTHVATDLDYCSLLRPYSELAVTAAFARLGGEYSDVFSSCNRNFRIRGPKPSDHWCGQCPKCHFVFLALAPFLPKPKLLSIFGNNLLDRESLASGFDALLEYKDHKPFECVGEGAEARAAMATLGERAEWREDALVRRFNREIRPQLDAAELDIAPWLTPSKEHRVPSRLLKALDEIRHA
ncbi:MAG TPA: UDP-N-acetyl-alpha-D-muramoyl-L-alanyl-L-glutamate epimerase [Oleiagrimonas sp.]|nr:UDP-N-acetyl-alpha-D-muramoyl-L-alanyl-L-glutamate epimerase [Oleiagrimonas sp.]